MKTIVKLTSIFLVCLMIGCAKDKGSADREATVIDGTPLVLSETLKAPYFNSPETKSKTRIGLTLDGESIGDGRFHYDQESGQSRLRFYVSYLDVTASSPDTYPASFKGSGIEILTDLDINEVFKDYNPKEKEIYLRRGASTVTIGKFRNVENIPFYLERSRAFSKPIICEEEYASVCSMSVRLEGSGNRPLAIITINLKDDSNVKAEVNPTKGFNPPYQEN